MGNLHPKSAGAPLASMIVVVLAWLILAIFKVTIPPEVAAAITGIVGFAVSYFLPAPAAPPAAGP